MPFRNDYSGLATPQFQPPPGRYAQNSTDFLDYGIDWSDWMPDGDSIASSVWSTDTGLALSNPSFTSSTTAVWVSGGMAGYLYRVVNTITTAGGRITARRIYFRITDDAADLGSRCLVTA